VAMTLLTALFIGSFEMACAPLLHGDRADALGIGPRCDRHDRRVGAGGADVPRGDPFSPSAEHCGGEAFPGYFATTFAALPLPRNGANIDIITPPPTAKQPEQIANAVAETSNCSGEPGTVSP
jgi:hypothetical protein